MTDKSVIPLSPRPLTVKAFGITDKGKVRMTNEDQFLIAELTKAMRVWQTSLPEPKVQAGEEHAHLFLVADGMGGNRAGERASALAVVAIEQFTLNTFKWFFGSSDTEAQKVLAQFQSALSQADARILEESAEHPTERHGNYGDDGVPSGGAAVRRARGRQPRVRGQRRRVAPAHPGPDGDRRHGAQRKPSAKTRSLVPSPPRHTNVVGGQELGVTVEARAFEVREAIAYCFVRTD